MDDIAPAGSAAWAWVLVFMNTRDQASAFRLDIGSVP
jgi:hypothetical protein